MSNFSNGVFPFGVLEWVWEVLVVVVEDDAVWDSENDEEDDEEGWEGGGFPPFHFESFFYIFCPLSFLLHVEV